MSVPDQTHLERVPRTDWLWLKRSVVIAWASWTTSIGLLYVEDRKGVLHPYSLTFLLLIALVFASGLFGLTSGLRRCYLGPHRRAALCWGIVAFVPSLLWIWLAMFGLREASNGDAPNTLPWKLVVMATASGMEAQARWMYPHRFETDHLVMFYDERVRHPQRDAEAMERHVARLEAVTGVTLRAKIHWVRGQLLGRGRMACRGLCSGVTGARGLGHGGSPRQPQRGSSRVGPRRPAPATRPRRRPTDADLGRLGRLASRTEPRTAGSRGGGLPQEATGSARICGGRPAPT